MTPPLKKRKKKKKERQGTVGYTLTDYFRLDGQPAVENFRPFMTRKLEKVTGLKHLRATLCKLGYVIHYSWQSLYMKGRFEREKQLMNFESRV